MRTGFSLKVVALFLAVLWMQSAPGVSGTVVRTLAYHQITGPTDLTGSDPISPVLCANGNRVVLSLYPSGTEDPQIPNRIFVMNPDGTGLKQVDSYTSLVFSNSFMDISNDGSKVVSTDAVQIRSANSDGSGATPLIALDSNEINELAISGDGTKVFFRIYRSTSIRGSNPTEPIENGIYVINTNGTGLRQIAGPSQLAALTGLPVTDFGFFGNATNGFSTLRASNDGGRLVFSCYDSGGQRLYGVNLDGGGLHDLFGELDAVYQSTISGDGTKIGYTVRLHGDIKDEAGTINYNGSGKVKLVDSTQSLPNVGGSFYLSRLQLSTDGSQLFMSNAGVLFNSDGSGVVALGLGSIHVGSDLAYDGLVGATMNGAANKFLYMIHPVNEPAQLARLDLDPASLGAAPSLTQPSINPAIVALNNGSISTETVRASSGVPVVATRTTFNGLPDNNLDPFFLFDDATHGDSTVGDGLFTYNSFQASCCAALGQHIMRFKGETTDAGGKRHATAIDYDGFLVVNSLPGISISDVSVVEGNSGTTNATFTVRLSAIPQVTATVNFATADDTATAPADYVAQTGTLTFSPGETSKTITIAVKGDTLDEDYERFTVNLSNASGATITDSQGLGTIRDDDNPPNFSIGDVTVTEGTGGTTNAVFKITLSTASGRATGITCVTANGTARSPGDYVPNRVNLTFAPGQTSQNFSVAVNGDALDEDAENFFALLTLPINAGVSKGRGICTINDDDAAPSITIEDVRIGEGNVGQRTAVFRLHLSAPSGKLVKVNYATAAGTTNPAEAGVDYVAVTPTQIAFTTGQTVTLARVLINGDTLNEEDETFKVNLGGEINATIADNQAIGTILNDDPAPAISIDDVSITEGNSGTKNLTFTVTLSAPSAKTISVNYTTADGIARSTSDYGATNGTLVFAANQTSRTLNVVINGDTTPEGNETFFVLLSGAVNASIGRARGVGTILNDDTSP